MTENDRQAQLLVDAVKRHKNGQVSAEELVGYVQDKWPADPINWHPVEEDQRADVTIKLRVRGNISGTQMAEELLESMKDGIKLRQGGDVPAVENDDGTSVFIEDCSLVLVEATN